MMDVIVDLLVICAYFVLVVYVGLRFAKGKESFEDFALGGRSIPWFAVLASIIAAETSAATFLGAPGEGFQLCNYSYLQILIGAIIGRIIVARLFIKAFFDYNVFSIYEYLEIRFGSKTRTAGSALFLVTRLLASGARLYVAAIIIAVGYQLFTGTQPTTEQQMVIYFGAILFITILTAVYTSVGGIKAVVWTDCIQSSVMFGGALSAIILLIFTMPGGFSTITDFFARTPTPIFLTGTESGGSFSANLRSVLTSEYTIWAAFLGATFTAMATHGTDQDMVQRMLTASDYKKSRVSLIASGFADIPIAFVFLTIGILMNCYYQQAPDPNLPGKNSEVFAYFILTRMPVGLRGLLVAGIFATAMGSLSAALNALSTSFTRDFYTRRRTAVTEDGTVRAAKVFTIVFAALMTVVAGITAFFVINHPDSRIIPIVLGIFGYTYGSLLGVFLLGFLTKERGSDVGNCIAMVSGFCVVGLLTGMPAQIVETLNLKPSDALNAIPVISFPWRITVGALTTILVASLFKREAQAAVPNRDILNSSEQ
ncbi:sodium:solute symporter [Candidatus Obscuribacterales bacterium]|nr:sodium:solute symporter [Candidatus Obscuribacterales bacterium]